MIEHPLRCIIDEEIHNRPPLQIQAPGSISYYAWMLDDQCGPEPDEAARAILRAMDAPDPLPSAPQIIAEKGMLKAKWERHSEFESLTLVEAGDTPEGDNAAQGLAKMLDAHAGERLVACKIDILSGKTMPNQMTLRQLAGFETPVGASLSGGGAAVWTDFKIGEDGFSRMVLWLDKISPSRAGRTVQRLLEIETYRMMAMLGFPVARQAHTDLNRIEKRFTAIIKDVELEGLDLDELRLWFERLQDVSVGVSRIIDQSEYRLSATKAYAAIVAKRLEDIREGRLEGLTRLSVFLERRMGPAMATCQSVRRRQGKLLRRIDSASSMFRGRMEIAVGLQNNAILKTIKVNAERQVKLQRTVEGLSVVAISYYVLGIIGIFAKGFEKVGVFEGWEVASAAIAPLAIAGVWVFLHRIRHKI